MGGCDDGSDDGKSGVVVLTSIFATDAIVGDVNAFTGSERFKEKAAFSAQIAHWSCGRDRYFGGISPRPSCLLAVSEAPRIDCAIETMLVDTLMRDIVREKRRRIDRALTRGKRKRRNSWQGNRISNGPVTLTEKPTVNACQTI